MRTERGRSWFHQPINGSIAIDRSVSQEAEHDACVVYNDTKIVIRLRQPTPHIACVVGQRTSRNISLGDAAKRR